MNFVCNKCGSCCKDFKNEKGLVIIYPCEVDRLSQNLGCSRDIFLSKYCTKDYLICDGTKYLFYKLRRRNKQCIFLKDNLCSIYTFKPIQCEKAPFQYFSYLNIWGHMPCVNSEVLVEANSINEDYKLVMDLMSGYREI